MCGISETEGLTLRLRDAGLDRSPVVVAAAAAAEAATTTDYSSVVVLLLMSTVARQDNSDGVGSVSSGRTSASTRRSTTDGHESRVLTCCVRIRLRERERERERLRVSERERQADLRIKQRKER